MKLLVRGKTKDVYALADGNYLLQFKDDVTGKDGVFDPGANTVGLTVQGAGQAGLKMSKYLFERLHDRGIRTHYVSADENKATMTVKRANMFGKGLEVICRYRAVGSFLRRYGMYAKEGQPLDSLVEVTLKDDERGDPLITEDTLAMLHICTREEYRHIVSQTKKISALIKEELAEKGLELYDLKLEFGKVGAKDEIVLIDELSGGNMRVYKDGRFVDPLTLANILLS